MGATTTRARRPIRCPRCGYDQHGETATWTTCCPIESTCVECGLRIRWGEILNPKLRLPKWCVEYGRARAFPFRMVRTIWMAWQPWRFWRTLKMVHEPRWRRIVLCFVLLLIGAYVLFAAAHAGLVVELWLMRAPWRGATPLPAGFPTSAWEAGWRAAAFPLSGPRRAFLYNESWPRDVFFGEWWPMLGTVLWTGFLLVMCPLGFVALPVSRRRAKVRWAHIVRITVYGLLPPLFLLIWWVTAKGVHSLPLGVSRSLMVLGMLFRMALGFATVLYIAHPLLWWSFATGRYLRIPHAWGVGLAITIIAALLTILLMCVVTILRGM